MTAFPAESSRSPPEVVAGHKESFVRQPVGASSWRTAAAALNGCARDAGASVVGSRKIQTGGRHLASRTSSKSPGARPGASPCQACPAASRHSRSWLASAFRRTSTTWAKSTSLLRFALLARCCPGANQSVLEGKHSACTSASRSTRAAHAARNWPDEIRHLAALPSA